MKIINAHERGGGARVRFTAVLSLMWLLPSVAPASEWEVAGEVSLEVRQFPDGPGQEGQDGAGASPSVKLEPELAREDDGGESVLTLRPFLRLDAHDANRTHFDLREASWLRLGPSWSLLIGMARVFWGVTESRHLVDIINQTDGVEDIDGEDKLGQPMVNVTLDGLWGSFDLFYLPYFRERTFPGSDARLRGPLPVSGSPVYEASQGASHQEWAVRWSMVLGALDLAISHFQGTSREPRLIPEIGPEGAFLRPHYDLIGQTGLEAQLTLDAWLFKLEAIRRSGHGESFLAAVAGFEYTLFGFGPRFADLGLIGELMVDDRGPGAPITVFDHDVFVGFRWGFNDVNDTSILGGSIVDYKTGEIIGLLEAERRLSDGLKLELEARWFTNTVSNGFPHSLRRDRHVTFRVTRFF